MKVYPPKWQNSPHREMSYEQAGELCLRDGDIFTEEEMAKLISGVVTAMGKATIDDIEVVVNWAWQARVDAALLRLLLEGRVSAVPTAERDDVVFTSLEEDVA